MVESLIPYLIESLIPYLEAVVPTYPRDLSLEGFLDLCHSYIIPLLLGLILGLFCLFPCLLGLFQLLLKGDDLSFGGGQLILGLAKEHPLAFSLPLNAVQGGLSPLFIPFYLSHFILHLVYSFLGHIEGLYSGVAPSFFFHLPVAVISYLFHPE